MVDRPPQPEHFASVPPPPAPPVRLRVVVGLTAAVLASGALVGAFLAHRSSASTPHPDPQLAARRAATKAHDEELRRAAQKVAAIKKRMDTLAIEAGVVSATTSKVGPVDAGVGAPAGSGTRRAEAGAGALAASRTTPAAGGADQAADTGPVLQPMVLPSLQKPVLSGWMGRHESGDLEGPRALTLPKPSQSQRPGKR